MRKFAIAAVILTLATAAHAADAPKPASPACGKTAEECQKAVDAMAGQVQRQAATIQALIQQRNSIRATADNAEVESFVSQQAAAAAKAPPAPK